ncbi:MAG: hypothetical protein QOG23_2855 [Blastocatellia bacterium]|jgi:hypothetical protein|nr:hypothetical protein [Blastocatellia bacterium]
MRPMSFRENLDFTNRFPLFVHHRRRSLGLNPYTLRDGRIGQKFRFGGEYLPLIGGFRSIPTYGAKFFWSRPEFLAESPVYKRYRPN